MDFPSEPQKCLHFRQRFFWCFPIQVDKLSSLSEKASKTMSSLIVITKKLEAPCFFFCETHSVHLYSGGATTICNQEKLCFKSTRIFFEQVSHLRFRRKAF
eukprot:UN22416